MRRHYFKVRQLMVNTVASIPFGFGNFVMQSEFTRNVIKLSTGSMLVTAFGLFITPVNTRLFSPEDYGLMNLLTATGGLFGVLLSFNINPVILMEKRQKIAETTATLSFILLGVSLMVIAGILFGFGDMLLPLIHAEALKPWLPLLFIAMGLGGIGTIITQLIQRKKMYGLFSKSTVLSNVTGHCIRIPWGYFFPSFYVLFLSNFIAGLLGMLYLLPHAFYSWRTSFRRLRFVFWRNFSFMINQTLSKSIGTVAAQLPIYWIAANCGTAEVGYFGMAATIIDIPCNLLLGSVTTVYYKRVADTVSNDPMNLPSLYWRTTWKMILMGLIPISCVGLLSPFIPAILGMQWEGAVPVLQLFLIWRFIGFVMAPTNAVITILRKNGFYVFVNILSLASTCIIMYYSECKLTTFISLLIVFGIIYNFLVFLWTILILKQFIFMKR